MDCGDLIPVLRDEPSAYDMNYTAIYGDSYMSQMGHHWLSQRPHAFSVQRRISVPSF